MNTPLITDQEHRGSLLRRLWQRGVTDRIIWNVGIAIVGVVGARLLGVAAQVTLGRLMGLEDFGLYTTLYTLLGPVIILSSLGLDTWLLRQGGKLDHLDETISLVFSLRIFMTIPVMALVMLGILAMRLTEVTPGIVTAAAFGLILELLLLTAHIALRAQVRNRSATLLQVSVPLLFITLVIAGWNSAAPIQTAVFYRLLAALVGLLMLLWLLRRSLRLVWRPGHLWPIIVDARMYFASDILAQMTMRADLILVALLLGTVAAGLHSPALLLINASFMVPSVAWQVLLPIIARQKNSTSGLRWIIASGIVGNTLYGLLWIGLAFWGSAWIIQTLFGSEFMGAVPLLQVMSVVPLLKSMSFCSTTLMVAYDAQALRTKIQAVVALAGLLIFLVAISFFGLMGAAAANVLVEMMLLIGYGYGAWITLRHYAILSTAGE